MFWRTASGSRATSYPATCARPEVGFSRPQSMRMVVDLPAPFGPRKPKTSPFADFEIDPVDGHKIAETLDQVLHHD